MIHTLFGEGNKAASTVETSSCSLQRIGGSISQLLCQFTQHAYVTPWRQKCVRCRYGVSILKCVLLICLQSNWNQIVDSFDDMNLREALLRGIYAYGFEKPSAIQQRAIIPCIKGR